MNLKILNPQENTWCNRYAPLNDYFTKTTPNQRLAMSKGVGVLGKATADNQKLKADTITPLVVSPSLDFNVWRANSLVNHSFINEQTPFDMYSSGYQVLDNCRADKRIVKETFSIPFSSRISELPVNMRTGPCNHLPEVQEYNKNIFTSTIQPGHYKQTRFIEPVNKNIGISYTPEFHTTECHVDETGTFCSEMTPSEARYKEQLSNIHEEEICESNIFDPRFSGYGSDNRTYFNEDNGYNEYFYDDINAGRMPNYISRSKIDMCVPEADKYSSLTEYNMYGNPDTDIIRELANKAFTDNAIEHRESIQESIMRKKNSEAWQRRVAPISTNGQYMAGGMRLKA